MIAASEKKTNAAILHYLDDDEITDVIDCIAANRPLKDIDEAICTAENLRSILAFIEHASADKNAISDTDTQFEVWSGLEKISGIARLLSLRVEQYLTRQALGEVKA